MISLVRRGSELRAAVEGSDYAPYQVRVSFDNVGVAEASCTCPYNWGGWCKHIVATLLTCLDRPEVIEVRPSLEELLAGLEREQLQALLLSLAAGRPDLVEAIEGQIELLRVAPTGRVDEAASGVDDLAPDPRLIRRQVRATMHSLDQMRRSEAYWHVGRVVDEIRQLLKQAQDLVEAGRGRAALALLEAITEEYLEGWEILDDSDGEVGGFFLDLGNAWLEAIVATELTPAERERWSRRLSEWQDELAEYGIEDAFSTAGSAVSLEGESTFVERVLTGDFAENDDSGDEGSWYTDKLIGVYLKTLERRGLYQEYLDLARAGGQVQEYLTMLVRLGRVWEAVDQGLELLEAPDDALALATALQQRGEPHAAIRIAEHGLTLEGPRGALAAWLSNLAMESGDRDLALRAAVIAFREVPSLTAYRAVQSLADEGWPDLRLDLLDHLRRTTGYIPEAQVDIFLHEGLIDDAIAAASKSGLYRVLERVMDAAIESRPDWGIQAAREQAEQIMDAGRSDAYHYAVQWLQRARAAYRVAGREADWQNYLDDLRTRHSRKYKLMGMLKAL